MRPLSILTLAMTAGLALAACPTAVDETDDGTGGSAPLTYRESECGTCVASACSSQIEYCGADPECAAVLSCLYECPLGASGEADSDCEAACPRPTAALGENALAALETCRASGAGAECEACGHPPAGHPLLEQECPPPTSAEACDACEEELCCGTRCGPACQGYVGCMQGCNGAIACQDGCSVDHAPGVEEFGRWLACQLPLCRDHCVSLVPGPCLECGLTHCPNQFADCFADPSCFLRFFCGTRCNTVACYDDCDAQYPEASALFGAFLVCVGEHCAGGPCDGGGEL